MKNKPFRDTRVAELLSAWASTGLLIIEDVPEEDDPLGILEACADASVQNEQKRRSAEGLHRFSPHEVELWRGEMLKMLRDPAEMRNEVIGDLRDEIIKELIQLQAFEETASLIRRALSSLRQQIAEVAMIALCDAKLIEHAILFAEQLNMSALERAHVLVVCLEAGAQQVLAYVRNILEAHHPQPSDGWIFAHACNGLFAYTQDPEDLVLARGACAAVQSPGDRSRMMRCLADDSRELLDYANAITAIEELRIAHLRSQEYRRLLVQMTNALLLPTGKRALPLKVVMDVRDLIPHQGWKRQVDDLFKRMSG
ncbi:MAG: hypothetical protein RL141_199 [Candidatus Parcubacteria bacterium]|jgi:hypothetical protein